MTKFVFDLQLFATNTTGSENLSLENKEYYDKNLIREAEANLIHDQFGQKKPIPKNGGKQIEFRKFASLGKSLTPLTEGVPPLGQSLKVTKVEATVSQYGDFVELSDLLDLTAIDPVVVETVKLIGSQAGLSLDTITRDILQSNTNAFYCPKKDGTVVDNRTELDATCLLTVDVIKDVVALLKRDNAPKIDGSYIAIVHPFVAKDIMSDPQWIDAYKYTTPENIFAGELGKIAGVRFIESSEAKVYFGDGCPTGLGVFGTLIMGANAYGTTEIEGGGLETIIKQLGSSGTADPLNQKSTVGWKATKTAEILIPQYIYRVESTSSLSSKIIAAN
jgi:N4-gp56 family major capsid protein